MLDTIKTKAADALIYILTPIVFVAGIVYFLVTRKVGFERKLEEAKAKEELARKLSHLVGDEQDAKTAIDEYNTIRERVLRSADKSDT